MANTITILRFALLFILAASALHAPATVRLLNAPLLVIMIAMDGLDGWVARRRGETSRFGSMLDVISDRVIENVLWVVLAYLGAVSIWVPVIVLARSFIVDSIRMPMVDQNGGVFEVMQTRLGRWLVKSRFMRALYGTLKAVTFATLLAIDAIADMGWSRWPVAGIWVLPVAQTLVWMTVGICVLRGLPVVVEWILVSRAEPNVSQREVKPPVKAKVISRRRRKRAGRPAAQKRRTGKAMISTRRAPGHLVR